MLWERSGKNLSALKYLPAFFCCSPHGRGKSAWARCGPRTRGRRPPRPLHQRPWELRRQPRHPRLLPPPQCLILSRPSNSGRRHRPRPRRPRQGHLRLHSNTSNHCHLLTSRRRRSLCSLSTRRRRHPLLPQLRRQSCRRRPPPRTSPGWSRS